MQLIKRQSRTACVPRDTFAQVRDMGARLEYVLARYERLVRDLGSDCGTTQELEARVRLANRELGHVATQLQEIFVERYESAQPLSDDEAADPMTLGDARVPFDLLQHAAGA